MWFSINKLSELTGFDRRTISARLKTIEPKKEGRSNLYETTEALPLLYGVEREGPTLDVSQERAALAREHRLVAEMRRKEIAGELMPASLVIKLGSSMVAMARSKLLAIHSKIRGRYPEIPEDVPDDVEQLIIEALNALGNNGIPKDLQTSIRRLEAPSKPVNKRVGR